MDLSCEELINMSYKEYERKEYNLAYSILKDNIPYIKPNSSYFFHLGLYSTCLKHHNRAIFFYKKSLEINQEHKSALTNLCCSYVCIKELELGLKYSKKLKSLDPIDVNIDELITCIKNIKRNVEINSN